MSVGLGISPGVYTKIIDLSGYLQNIPGTTGFCAFLSRKGPDNKLTHITSLQDFADKFGRPNINDYGKLFGQGPYICWNHITVSPDFYCIRALPDDATFSNLILYLNTDTTATVIAEHVASLNSIGEVNQAAGREGVLVEGELVYDVITDLNSWSSTGDTVNGRPFVTFYPIGRGDYYDNIGITFELHSNTNLPEPNAEAWQKYYIINVYETQSDGSDAIVEAYTVSFDEDQVDSSGNTVYIENIINSYSKYIKCIVNKEVFEEWVAAGAPEINIGLGGLEITHLFGGSEGNIVTITSSGKRKVDFDNAKQNLIEAYSGLKDDAITETDNLYLPLIYDAGYPADVKQAIVDLASETRLDGVAILDNGDNVSYDDAITARTSTNDFNTKYAALFEEYNKVYDVHTGKDIWVSPVYHMASMIPLNDALYNLWYPNAGFQRATISDIKELRFSPKLTQRDYFYLKQLNPIVKFSVGYTMWGNLTTQTKPSALQDLSIVRLVLYIQRALEQFCKNYIFQFNNEETWSAISSAIIPFLQSVQSQKGLESFTVNVGATEYEKKIKRCHVDVTLVPMRVIERIELNLYVK